MSMPDFEKETIFVRNKLRTIEDVRLMAEQAKHFSDDLQMLPGVLIDVLNAFVESLEAGWENSMSEDL